MDFTYWMREWILKPRGRINRGSNSPEIYWGTWNNPETKDQKGRMREGKLESISQEMPTLRTCSASSLFAQRKGCSQLLHNFRFFRRHICTIEDCNDYMSCSSGHKHNQESLNGGSQLGASSPSPQFAHNRLHYTCAPLWRFWALFEGEFSSYNGNTCRQLWTVVDKYVKPPLA